MSFQHQLQKTADRLAVGVAQLLQFRQRSSPPPRPGILCYHRVHPDRRGPTWNVPPDVFRDQLTQLLALGYQPTRLCELLRHPEWWREPRLVLTFDDGYESVREFAAPVLHDLNIPATIFLCTAYIDSDRPFPFDDWRVAGSSEVAANAWKPLSWKSCDALLQTDWIELGSHTHTHRDYRGRMAELESDVQQSVAVLQQRWGLEQIPFSFPYGYTHLGYVSEAAIKTVRRVGVSCALSLEPRPIRPGDDPFHWGRIDVRAYDTGASLLVKLGDWYGSLRRGLRRIRPWNRVPARSTLLEGKVASRDRA